MARGSFYIWYSTGAYSNTLQAWCLFINRTGLINDLSNRWLLIGRGETRAGKSWQRRKHDFDFFIMRQNPSSWNLFVTALASSFAQLYLIATALFGNDCPCKRMGWECCLWDGKDTLVALTALGLVCLYSPFSNICGNNLGTSTAKPVACIRLCKIIPNMHNRSYSCKILLNLSGLFIFFLSLFRGATFFIVEP